MAALRRNIRVSGASNRYLDAVSGLDSAMSGVMVSHAVERLAAAAPGLQLRGVDQELSYYDLLVLWHAAAMSIPMGGPGQNAAHNGPIFLPWHRHYMLILEQWLQTVLDDDQFGLPYWDWAADGDLPVAQQWQTDLWTAEALGESRGEIVSGRVAQMRVRLWQDPQTQVVWSIDPRPIRRAAGQDGRAAYSSLPTSASVRMCLREPEYDKNPWARQTVGHRARLEGWVPSQEGRLVDLHNLVHVWIGGDMAPGTSPNDPAFFLNHSNVDRIWERWQVDWGREYSPAADQGPMGHRVNSAMFTLIGDTRMPSDVLDAAPWYSYDNLHVA